MNFLSKCILFKIYAKFKIDVRLPLTPPPSSFSLVKKIIGSLAVPSRALMGIRF